MNKQDLLNLIGEVLREDSMDEPTKEIKPAYRPKIRYTYLYDIDTLVIFKDASGSLYAFDHENIPENDFADYTDQTISYKGKSKDETEYEDEDIDITPEVLESYVNAETTKTQSGLEEFLNNSSILTKIDKELANHILEEYPSTRMQRTLQSLVKESRITEITINGEPINANDIKLGLVVVDKNKGEDWQIVDVYKKTKEVGIKNLDTYNTIDITITSLLKNYYKKSDKLMKINETKKMKKQDLVKLIKECHSEIINEEVTINYSSILDLHTLTYKIFEYLNEKGCALNNINVNDIEKFLQKYSQPISTGHPWLQKLRKFR